MNEAELVKQLLQALRVAGWRACHFRPARTSHGWRTPVEGDAGLPDIVAVHPRLGVLMIEAKSDDGRLRPEQLAWQEALEAAHARHPAAINYAVVRPLDWRSGAIDALLGYGGDTR